MHGAPVEGSAAEHVCEVVLAEKDKVLLDEGLIAFEEVERCDGGGG